MYEEYRDRVAFFVVYIHEAHTSDAWQMASNVRDQVIFTTPRSIEDKSRIAGACVRRLGINIPALLDEVSDSVEAAYTGWPDRLYVIDRAGSVAFKSAPGPFGFHPQGVADALARLLSSPRISSTGSAPGPRRLFP